MGSVLRIVTVRATSMSMNGLLVFNLRNLAGEPEPHTPAAIVKDGHGIGEDVIELRDGLFRKQVYPFAAFGLHGDEGRHAFHAFKVIANTGVVGDGEIQ